MLLIRLEISLQCASKVCPRGRIVGRAEQAMMHVPGSLQEKSYFTYRALFRELEQQPGISTASLRMMPQAGRGPGCMVRDGGPRRDWAGRVNPFGRLSSWTDFH